MDSLHSKTSLSPFLQTRSLERSVARHEFETDENAGECALPLMRLPLNATRRLFECLVEKEIFSPCGEFIKKESSSLPPLDVTGIERLSEVFSIYELAAGLLHIVPELIELGIDPEKAFRITGSGVFWLLGANYVSARFAEVGIVLSDVFTVGQIEGCFKKPADIDVRIDLWGLENEVLESLGKKIARFLQNKSQSNKLKISGAVLWKKAVDVGTNCCYTVKLTHESTPIGVDIMSTGKLKTQYLFDSDDCFLPLSLHTLQILTDAAAGKPSEMSERALIIPDGEVSKGWRAILLRVTDRKLAQNPAGIDFRGIVKYLVSLAEGKLSLSKELDQTLFIAFFSILAHSADGKGMKEIVRAVTNHFGGDPAALTAVQFNLLRYISMHDFTEYFFPSHKDPMRIRSGNLFPVQHLLYQTTARVVTEEMRAAKVKELKRKILFPPQSIQKGKKEYIQSSQIKALQALMETEEISYEVLSAYLLVQAHLLESRKQSMLQKSPIFAVRDWMGDKGVTLMNWGGKGVTLLLVEDLLYALEILDNHFKNKEVSGNLISKIEMLCKPFSKGIEGEYLSPDFIQDYYSHEERARLEQAAARAVELLKCPVLKIEAFLLLCQCGYNIQTAIYLPIACSHLLNILTDAASPELRVIIFRQFLQYLESCQREDFLFVNGPKQFSDKLQPVEELKCFFKLLETLNVSNDMLKINCCKILAYSRNVNVAALLLQFIKLLPEKSLNSMADNIIAKYLYMGAPNLALAVLETLAQHKQVSYGNLGVHLNMILAAYKLNPHLLSAALIGIVQVAEKMLNKMTASDKLASDSSGYLDLINLLLQENNLIKAASLLHAVQNAGISRGNPAFLFAKQLEICMHFMKAKQWGAAFKHWQEADIKLKEMSDISSGDVAKLLHSLMTVNDDAWTPALKQQWRLLFFNAPLEKLSSNDAQSVLSFISKIFAVETELPIPLFQSKGRWLLEQIEVFFLENGKKNAFPKHLEIYFSIAKSAGLVCEENVSVHEILGAYCFKAFIAPPLAEQRSCFSAELLEIVEEMLKSTAMAVKMNGISLLCNTKHSVDSSKSLAVILGALPELLISEESVQSRLILLKQFWKFLSNSIPDFMNKEQQLVLEQVLSQNESNSICRTFCEIFSRISPLETFEAVFTAWHQITVNSRATGVMLIDSYQENHPELALSVMAAQMKLGGFSIAEVGKYWNQFLKDSRINLQNGTSRQLLQLSQIALALIPKINGNNTAFANDLFCLIDRLLVVGESSLAITLYENAENKKLFNSKGVLDSRVQINLCSQLFKQGKKIKAYSLCTPLISIENIGKATPLLLEWSEGGLEFPIIELMLKALPYMSQSDFAFSFAEHIIVYQTDERKKRNLSADWQKALKGQAGNLIIFIKQGIMENHASAWAITDRLFKLLPCLNLELSIVMDEYDYWDIFLAQLSLREIKNEILPICSQLIGAADLQGKKNPHQKSAVYFLLAKHYLASLNAGIKCLERAIMAAKSEIVLDLQELELISEYIAMMRQHAMLPKIKELLEKVEKKCIFLPLEWRLDLWQALLLEAAEKMPWLASSILIEKCEFFNSSNILEQLLPIATNVAGNLLKQKSSIDASLLGKLSQLYMIREASVWLRILNSLHARTFVEEGFFKWILEQNEPFIGSINDCQDCWLALIRLTSDKNSGLIVSLLPRLTQILELFNTRDNQCNQELTLLLLENLIALLQDPSNSTCKQEIYQKIKAIMPADPAASQEKYINIELKLLSYSLKDMSQASLENAVTTLSKKSLCVHAVFKKTFLALFQDAVKLYFNRDLPWHLPTGQQLINIYDVYWKQIDPAIAFGVEMLNPNDQTYFRVVEMFFSEKNGREIKFNEAQKNQISQAFDKFFAWLNIKKESQLFNHLLTKVFDAKLMTIDRLKHWHAVRLQRVLNVACLTTDETRLLKVTTVLKIYGQQLSKIGGEHAPLCHELAATLFLSLSQDSSYQVANELLNAFTKNDQIKIESFNARSKYSAKENNEVLDIHSFLLLAFLFQAHVELEDDEFKRSWHRALEKISTSWNILINSKVFVQDHLLIEECFNKVFKNLTQAVAEVIPRSTYPGSSTADKKGDNLERGKQLQEFICTLLDQMTQYKFINFHHQASLLTIIYFHLVLLMRIFPENPNITQKILNLCAARVYPEEILFHFQFAVVEHLFKLHLKTICVKQTQAAAEGLYMLSLRLQEQPMLVGPFEHNVIMQMEGMIRVITSLCTQGTLLHIDRALNIMDKFQNTFLKTNLSALRICYTQLYLSIALFADFERSKEKVVFENVEKLWFKLARCLVKIERCEMISQIIAPIMPLSIETLEKREFYDSFLKVVYDNLLDHVEIVQLCYENWGACLRAHHYHSESTALLNNKFYEEIIFNQVDKLTQHLHPLFLAVKARMEEDFLSIKENLEILKKTLRKSIYIHNMPALFLLREYYLKYFDLLISSGDHWEDQKKHYSMLLSELNEVDELPKYWGNPSIFVTVNLKILLLEKLIPIAAKQLRIEAHEKFFGIFAHLTPLDDTSSLALFIVFEKWIEALSRAGQDKVAELAKISELRCQLFYNAPTSLMNELQKFWSEMVATSADFFEEIIIQENPLAKSIEESPLDCFPKISNSVCLVKIPRWKHFGDKLLRVKGIKSEESINVIRIMLINYIEMLVFLSNPKKLDETLLAEKILKLSNELPPAFLKDACHISQKLQRASCFTFLLKVIEQAQTLPFMQNMIIEILYLYETVMPLAVLQDKIGRQLWYSSFAGFHKSHNDSFSWCVDNLKIATGDYFYSTLEKWFLCCSEDHKDEAIKLSNEDFAMRIFYGSPVAVNRASQAIIKKFRKCPDVLIDTNLLVSGMFLFKLVGPNVDYVDQKNADSTYTNHSAAGKLPIADQSSPQKRIFPSNHKVKIHSNALRNSNPALNTIRSLEGFGKMLTQSTILHESEKFFDAVALPFSDYFDLAIELYGSNKKSPEFYNCYLFLLARLNELKALPYISSRKDYIEQLSIKLDKMVDGCKIFDRF